MACASPTRCRYPFDSFPSSLCLTSAIAQRSQTFQDYEYPIFLAEVASTFNEELLTHHLLETTTDHADPVLKGHVETVFAPWGSAQIGLAHARVAWPSNLDVKVQKTGDLPALTFELRADVATLYGEQFVGTLNAQPRSAFIADGSPIEIWQRTMEPA